LRHILNFSSLASHELRTPLSVIRAQLELILRTGTSVEAIRDSIASVYDEVLTLNHIIEELLDLSQLIAGTLRIKPQQVNIRSYLQDFYDEGGLLARSKNISLFFRLGPDITILIDPIKMRQVLFNILDNAIKNTPEKGKIHMSYDVTEEFLELKIEDNGIGIPKDAITKIFEPFYKGSNSHSRTSAGLGLSLVKALIEAHHGNLLIESEQGKGTTVHIQLPLLYPSEK
jgi:signal transduction histidine kinase